METKNKYAKWTTELCMEDQSTILVALRDAIDSGHDGIGKPYNETRMKSLRTLHQELQATYLNDMKGRYPAVKA